MAGKIFIALDNLTSVLEKLAGNIDVWIPAKSDDDKMGVEFQPFRTGMVPVLNRRSTLPPKKVLLPQVETLLKFEYRKDTEDPSKTRIHLDDGTAPRPALVFGARPCDARGFLTFDRVFTCGPYVDGYFRKRRESTLFATLICREADGACFCSAVGSGPTDMEGSDLRITPVQGGFVIEALHAKAEPFLDSMGGAPADARQEAAAKSVLEEVSQRIVGDLDVEGSPQAFLKRFEDKSYWQDMALQCLSCGICTYVCPTCYCFTITDEIKNLQGERLRSWDSCMFCHYSSEASGHNPRPTKLERYRNRVGHKFSYIPEKYDGLIGCCGCGRCIRSCPVSIDIRNVVERLKEDTCECA